jgi:hypothetical protein
MIYPYIAALQRIREQSGLALDLCFSMKPTRGFFLKYNTTDHQNQPPSYKLVHERALRKEINSTFLLFIAC